MASATSKLLQLILPKRKPNEKGLSQTSTYNASNPNQVLTVPTYRDHIVDIFDTRQSSDSRALIKQLLVHDPDMSASLNSYLTVAATPLRTWVYDMEGALDRDGHKLLNQLLLGMGIQQDYSLGFQIKTSLSTLAESMRYMLLMRGGIGAELVVDKTYLIKELRLVDLATVKWIEKQPGAYKPQQEPPGSNSIINLDIPTFFTSWFRRDPTSIYSYSPFVSSINTIAARQQIINDLYRIMQVTGYPRIELTVLEEVLLKNAPANIKSDPVELKSWRNERLQEIANIFSGMRPDQPFAHFDSIETKVMNEMKPSMAINIDSVINTLNSQNQAGLKTMATIIGRGESGVNTASVEARIFAMNAEQLNAPVADIMSQMLTMALRLQGFEGYVVVEFASVELRPELEREPQLTMKASRLRQDLSDGLITDDEYHMHMYGRIRPDDTPELMGTKFMTPVPAIDASKASPNSDPLGRSLTSPGSKSAKSNQVKK